MNLDQAERSCPCCLGDPDTVCAACGSHSCWAGYFMCHDSYSAGTRPWREGDPVEPMASRPNATPKESP